MVQYKINAEKSNARCIFARDKSASTTTLPSAFYIPPRGRYLWTPVNGPKEKYTTVPIEFLRKCHRRYVVAELNPSGQHILSWPVETGQIGGQMGKNRQYHNTGKCWGHTGSGGGGLVTPFKRMAGDWFGIAKTELARTAKMLRLACFQCDCFRWMLGGSWLACSMPYYYI